MTVFEEAFHDTALMLPLLFAVYALLEIIERKFENPVKNLLLRSAAAGPLIGALLGCIPQCGFSVIAAVLYSQGVLTTGTLLAVFLSTSDEAIPVILAQPDKAGVIAPVLFAKISIAIVAGYGTDLVSRIFSAGEKVKAHDPSCHCLEAAHCCGIEHGAADRWWRSYLLIPAWHALKIFLFLFIVTMLIGVLIERVGEDNLSAVLFGHTFFQPLIAVLVGFIPNCAASVVITQLFLKGGLDFGAAMAGLCASSGLGVLMLFRVNIGPGRILRIVALLAGFSLLAGLVINLIVP